MATLDIASTPNRILYGPSRKPWRETLSPIATSAADGGKLLVSAPSSDPLERDVVPDGVTSTLYQVPSSGLTCEERDRALEETLSLVKRGSKLYSGFMNNQGFDFPPLLQSRFANVMMNNAGDPFTVGSALYTQPKWVERNVLDYYASLWNAKWPHDPNDPETYWGYVLTMGSTEGNMHALWSARNYLSGRYIETISKGQREYSVPLSGASGKEPVVFFSKCSHSTHPKLCDMVNVLTFDVVGCDRYPNENPLGGVWSQGVPCTGGDAGPGTVDIDALEKVVDFFSSKGHPIIVVFNYGTTLKGGCDDVQTAGERLVKVLKKNNMYERTLVDPDNPSSLVVRRGFWFHVDGALAAAYMPFLEMAYKNGLTDIKPASTFDFQLDFISSIVMSGHKYIGVPWPSGVYIVRNSNCLQHTWNVPYFATCDRTVAFSRNGHSAILFWSYISTHSYDAQAAILLKCLRVITYAMSKFHELQRIISIDLWITNWPPSLSIMFRQPNPRFIEKYTLTSSTLCVNSEMRPIVQFYAMPHVTTAQVDALIQDLQAPDAFQEL